MGALEIIKLETMWKKMTEENKTILKKLEKMQKDIDYLITINELQNIEIEELKEKLHKKQ